jgi:hypothetical protein
MDEAMGSAHRRFPRHVSSTVFAGHGIGRVARLAGQQGNGEPAWLVWEVAGRPSPEAPAGFARTRHPRSIIHPEGRKMPGIAD